MLNGFHLVPAGFHLVPVGLRMALTGRHLDLAGFHLVQTGVHLVLFGFHLVPTGLHLDLAGFHLGLNGLSGSDGFPCGFGRFNIHIILFITSCNRYAKPLPSHMFNLCFPWCFAPAAGRGEATPTRQPPKNCNTLSDASCGGRPTYIDTRGVTIVGPGFWD